MPSLTTPTRPATAAHRARPVGPSRWMVSFAGFPLGGFAADPPRRTRRQPRPARSLGGLVTGAVLGAVQAWAPGPDRAVAPRLDRSPPPSA